MRHLCFRNFFYTSHYCCRHIFSEKDLKFTYRRKYIGTIIFPLHFVHRLLHNIGVGEINVLKGKDVKSQFRQIHRPALVCQNS